MAASRGVPIYWGCVVIAVLGVVYVNTHTDETGIIAGSLFLAALALSALRPRWAGWSFLLLALSVPVSQLVMRFLGLRAPYPNNLTDIVGALVPALIVAALGTAIGWGVGRFALHYLLPFRSETGNGGNR